MEDVSKTHAEIVRSMDEQHFDDYLSSALLLEEERDSAKSELGQPATPRSRWLCPWQPSHAGVIEALAAGLGKDDVVLDLGCGDGRVVTRLVQLTGCRAVGWDVSPSCIATAKEILRREGVMEECARFETRDFTDEGCADEVLAMRPRVTLVYMYLVAEALTAIEPLVSALCKAGIPLVTHEYHFADGKPEGCAVASSTEAQSLRRYAASVPQTAATSATTSAVQPALHGEGAVDGVPAHIQQEEAPPVPAPQPLSDPHGKQPSQAHE